MRTRAYKVNVMGLAGVLSTVALRLSPFHSHCRLFRCVGQHNIVLSLSRHRHDCLVVVLVVVSRMFFALVSFLWQLLPSAPP